jgi:hypothetical protein
MRFCLIGVLLVVLPATAAAKPDFSLSTVTFDPPRPLEGDLVTMILSLQNSGTEDALHADVDVTLPTATLFADMTGLDNANADLHGRIVHWSGRLDAGTTRRAHIRLIVPRDGAGETIATMLRIRYAFAGSEARIHAQTEIGTAPSSQGVLLGGVRFRTPEFVLLGVIAGGVLVYLVVRLVAPRATRPAGPVVAIVIAVGFWTIFASMARLDWRVLREYQESQCTILDSRVRIETTAESRPGRAATATPTATAEPLLALRFRVNDTEQISAGFRTRSYLQIGGAARAAAAMNNWRGGTVLPCWYDPGDPRQVVVQRGFGGAYVFALFPLPVFVFGVWLLRSQSGLSKRARRRR